MVVYVVLPAVFGLVHVGEAGVEACVMSFVLAFVVFGHGFVGSEWESLKQDVCGWWNMFSKTRASYYIPAAEGEKG